MSFGIFVILIITLFSISTVSAFLNATTITANSTNGTTWFKGGTNQSINFTFLFTTLPNSSMAVTSINFTSTNFSIWAINKTNSSGWTCSGATNYLNCSSIQPTSSLNITLNVTLNSSAYEMNHTLTINISTNASEYGLTGGNKTTYRVAVDGVQPLITMPVYTNGTAKKNTDSLTFNVSVADTGAGAGNCYVNISQAGYGGWLNQSISATNSRWCNTTSGNLSSLTDGNATIYIFANDSVGNINSTTIYVVQVDTTNPVPTATCSPTSVSSGASFPCTCSATDAISGVSSSSGSSTSGSITSTSSTGTFTYTCYAIDNAENSATTTKTYSVVQTPSTGSSTSGTSSSSSATTTTKATTTAPEINPGVASVMKYSDPAIGVKQISVEVDNKAQNVQVTVTKEAGKPANVSVAKSGKVYQYLHIETKNLADKLDKATVQFKVTKTWVSDNGLTKDKVAVSKFNETADKWNELATTYSSEDNTYYYYDVELTSFSYFAIYEKSVTAAATGETGGEETGEETGEEDKAGGSLTWLWILIAIIVLVAIGWTVKKKKE